MRYPSLVWLQGRSNTTYSLLTACKLCEQALAFSTQLTLGILESTVQVLGVGRPQRVFLHSCMLPSTSEFAIYTIKTDHGASTIIPR
jgi:hypothetical protein